MRAGVLALQGAFREHIRALRALGAEAVEIRLPAELDEVDGRTFTARPSDRSPFTPCSSAPRRSWARGRAWNRLPGTGARSCTPGRRTSWPAPSTPN